MDAYKYTLLFILIGTGGMIFEVIVYDLYIHFTKKHLKEYHFELARYIFLLLPPLLATLLIIFNFGHTPAIIFIIFALIGPVLEWLLGWTYHNFLGTRLWTYHKLNILGYTSWLTIPFWGFAGITFWLLVTEILQ